LHNIFFLQKHPADKTQMFLQGDEDWSEMAMKGGKS